MEAGARLPLKATKYAAGYDLYSNEEAVVKAKGKQLVKTGICLKIPEGHYGRVAPRSGLACKHFIDVGAGVIDSDYRGELMILLFNFSDKDFLINKHERVAQLILERISHCPIEEVADLDQTDRN